LSIIIIIVINHRHHYHHHHHHYTPAASPAASLLLTTPLPPPAITEMTPADVPSARALLNSYLEKFNLWPDMNDEEFAHWLLPRQGVINSYVIRDDKGVVTDMCSFYHLTSTVIKNDQNPKLYAVYSFYNVATSIPFKVRIDPLSTSSVTYSPIFLYVLLYLLWLWWWWCRP